MTEFDAGPPPGLAQHFASLPSVAAHRQLYWYDWGPVFYRGRLDGSARLMGIASDPGPTERIACRTLVGDAVHPGKASQAKPVLAEPGQRSWRNQLYDYITGPPRQAIVAFGDQAQEP